MDQADDMDTYRLRAPGALALILTATACAGGGAGGLGDILGTVLGGQQPASSNVGQLVAEVQAVDTRNQRLDVVTQDGQRGQIEYDGNTSVTYQQQQYPVTALERGDVVEMRIQEVGQGRYYTDQILVRQSVQQREGTTGGGQVVQVSGTVAQIDHQRGWFDLDTGQGAVTVTLPYNPPVQTVRDFEQLRRGSRVSLEGYRIASDRIELARFR